MKKIPHLVALSLLVGIAAAPAAFAQSPSTTVERDGSTPSIAANESASGKHFAVVGGITLLQPQHSARTDGGPAATVGFNYYINDNIALELWGAASKFHQTVRGPANARYGDIDQQPIALSGQYHFGNADNVFRPFIGAGYYQSKFSKSSVVDPDVGAITLDKAKGAIGTLGLDMNINSTWFARADARYMQSRPEMRVDGTSVGKAKLNPWTVGFSMGARF